MPVNTWDWKLPTASTVSETGLDFIAGRLGNQWGLCANKKWPQSPLFQDSCVI